MGYFKYIDVKKNQPNLLHDNRHFRMVLENWHIWTLVWPSTWTFSASLLQLELRASHSSNQPA